MQHLAALSELNLLRKEVTLKYFLQPGSVVVLNNDGRIEYIGNTNYDHIDITQLLFFVQEGYFSAYCLWSEYGYYHFIIPYRGGLRVVEEYRPEQLIFSHVADG